MLVNAKIYIKIELNLLSFDWLICKILVIYFENNIVIVFHTKI